MSRLTSVDQLVTSKAVQALNPTMFPHAAKAAETQRVAKSVPNGTASLPNAELSGNPCLGVFGNFCARFGLPRPVEEFRFHKTRRWRLDYAWPDRMIGLEVEGGVWTGGRHTRGAGFMADIEKYNSAAVLGWRILRTVPDDLMVTKTAQMLKEIFR